MSIVPPALFLSIGARAAGAYSIRARLGAVRAQADLHLPDALVVRALRLRRPGVTMRVRSPDTLGELFGSALLVPPVRALLLEAAREAAQSHASVPLYLRIAAPELSVLPWEWMSLGTSQPWRPALREDYPLARIVRRTPPLPPLVLRGPLRVLAIAASSLAGQLHALARALEPLVADGLLTLDLLSEADAGRVASALERTSAHVLHCAAPLGWGTAGEPLVQLGRAMSAQQLLHAYAGAPALRVITLVDAACPSGHIAAAGPLLAAALSAQGVPAALALGGGLGDDQIGRFAASCYRLLAEGSTLDQAATAGRQALAEQGPGWGFAQLYVLPGGERLFRLAPARGSALPLVRLGVAGLTAALLAGSALWSAAQLPSAERQVRVAQTQPSPSTFPASAATPTAAPSPTPTPTAAPSPTATPLLADLSAPQRYAIHLAGEGETVALIAQRFGSEPWAIDALNRLDGMEPRTGRALAVPVYGAGEPGMPGVLVARGNPAAPRVALTFDIEIDPGTLYGILDILRARGLRATFFVTGRWVQVFPDAARAIVADGHEIGNHSLTHPFFSQIGPDGAASEIEQTERIIRETTGATSRPFFRFPYGDSNAHMLALAGAQGFVAFHWSADDHAIPVWLDAAAARPDLASGAILLLHGRPATVAALPGWLDRLADLGLRPGSLSETLR
ncbi:MAG TPA: polysaccharide deacetylase family protein [Roseiflexaceae bacterium]|nr:polysaccharide deacetylase family protein [Roseiflexaceae bacterium]